MSHSTVRIGTRGSKLARWQAEWVAAELSKHGVNAELVFIKTSGDVTSGPIGQIGGQGVFTKAIQSALLNNEVDLAVHSLKDLPTDDIDGLVLAAVPEREQINDALVGRVASTIGELPPDAKVGTGSTRRRSQLLAARPDLTVVDIRGNVETRLQKLDNEEFDAIVLASAGLKRLGFDGRITEIISTAIMLPAIGQGALGLETRVDDSATRVILQRLDHAITHQAVIAERKLLSDLRGGCMAPIAAWARAESNQLVLDAAVFSIDGTNRVTVRRTATLTDGRELGTAAAAELIELGAADLIDAARNT
ncbi:MAG: hydroxymethylbilane synthase [Planctomycetales bacterium]|nr:hydroxymethylbilane synthase [Planctomycetales bacterium]